MTDKQDTKTTETKVKTPEQIGEDLVVMMESLASIMARETEALKNKEMNVIQDTSRDKVQLLREYQDTLVVLSHNPNMLKNIKGDLRSKLKATREQCEGVAQTNHSSLKGALYATQNLIETIVKAAVKSAQKTDAYKDPRTKHLELGTHNPVCDPVALCRTV